MNNLVKQDINFLENPLWMVDSVQDENGLKWTDKDGFIYLTKGKAPDRTDAVFLYWMLRECQRLGWSDVLELSRYELIKGCGLTDAPFWYNRLEDSLTRWMDVTVSFKGIWYDSEEKKSVKFHVVDAFELPTKKGEKLKVYFSQHWLTHIKESKFYKLIPFDEFKALRSPIAARLYEILIKSFQGRDTWEIDAHKLAEKIPIERKYISDILIKIKPAVHRICENTDLKIDMTVRRSKDIRFKEAEKAILVFRKLSLVEYANTQTVCDLSDNQKSDFDKLLAMIPEKNQIQKTVVAVIQKYLRVKNFGYVKHNIEYTNANAKRSYAGYLQKCLSGNWAEYSEAIDPKIRQQRLENVSKQLGFNSVADFLASNPRGRLVAINASAQTINELLGV